jgi:hypothetical protein
MLRRTAISALWFVSILLVHELAWSVFGSPRPLGPILGIVAASFVWLDPFRQLHMSPSPRLRNVSAKRLVPDARLASR